MPENIPNPTMEIRRAAVAKLRSANTARSRMGSVAISSRTRKPASAQKATTASATMVGEVAAHGRPQDGAEDEAHSPHRHGEPALLEGEDLPEDGLGERDDRSATQALEDAGHDERGQIGSGAGDERADDKQRGADQE